MLNKINIQLSSYQTPLFAPLLKYNQNWVTILLNFGGHFKVMAISIQRNGNGNVNDI
jgi:hypothetical protein